MQPPLYGLPDQDKVLSFARDHGYRLSFLPEDYITVDLLMGMVFTRARGFLEEGDRTAASWTIMQAINELFLRPDPY